MKNLIATLLLMIVAFSAKAQFLIPEFEKPVVVKSLSDESEETTPILFNNGTEILYHRLYLKEKDEEISVQGKDIWYSDLDVKATESAADTVTLKKVWKRPYRFFAEGEIPGINSVFGMSEDGQRIYLINIEFDKDTFQMSLVQLNKKGKKSWEKDFVKIDIPGVMLDGRNLDLHMNSQEDVIMVSMAPTFKSQNEDLYVSLKEENGKWGELTHLGNTINTNRFEVTPFLSEDKKTLYFTSNGHDGFGRGDIFVSTRLDDSWQKWSRPLNLGEPINSKDFDAYFTVSGKEDVYFVSDRASEYDDLFYARATGKYTIPNLDSTEAQFFFRELPTANTQLEVYDADGNLLEIVVTDDEGKFKFVRLETDDDYVIKMANAEDNAELVGGKLYILNEDGEKVKRYILDEDGVFKPAKKIKARDLIQGVYAFNKEPKPKHPILVEDANAFVIDTVYTNEEGKFSYEKLAYDTVFTMYPELASGENYEMADLYLTDSEGNRTRTFDVAPTVQGEGKLVLQNLPIANSVVKIYNTDGDLLEVVMTNEDGSFSYKKLQVGDNSDLIFQIEDAKDVDLVGGIVYLYTDDKKQQRYFIQEGNRLVDPSSLGQEDIFGKFNYNKLPGANQAIEILDINGIPIDTVYTDESGNFKYSKLTMDKDISIRPIGLEGDDMKDLEIYLTDAKGGNKQIAAMQSAGSFSFKSVQSLAEAKPNTSTVASKPKVESKPSVKPTKPTLTKASIAENVFYFGFNQTNLSTRELDRLKTKANALKPSSGDILLVGHTDSVDDEETNQMVGMNRANYVKEQMIKMGIDASRIKVSSKGELEPAVPNNTAEGRSQNRRVEIK